MAYRSFRSFDKMARVVIVTSNSINFVRTEFLYGPYETAGIAEMMRKKIVKGHGNRVNTNVVDSWVEELKSATWERNA